VATVRGGELWLGRRGEGDLVWREWIVAVGAGPERAIIAPVTDIADTGHDLLAVPNLIVYKGQRILISVGTQRREGRSGSPGVLGDLLEGETHTKVIAIIFTF
jgi:hypothetical protein